MLLLIERKGKEVERNFHQIRNYGNETIETLCKDVQREFHGEGVVAMKKNGFTRETLLKDVGEKEICFVINAGNSKCTVV